MSKKSFKLSDLDFNNIGGWPQQARIVFCVVVGLFIMVLAWFLLISSKRDELEGLEGTETQLRTEFGRGAVEECQLPCSTVDHVRVAKFVAHRLAETGPTVGADPDHHELRWDEFGGRNRPCGSGVRSHRGSLRHTARGSSRIPKNKGRNAPGIQTSPRPLR